MSAVSADAWSPPAPVPPASPRPSWLDFWRGVGLGQVTLAGIFLALLAMSIKPALDPDLFWHLSTGRLIWQTGQIPHSDPFSWSAAGRPWIAHEWLTETILYPLYQLGGYTLLSMVWGAVITAAFIVAYAVARYRGASRIMAAAVVFLAALASAHTWGVRPQMLSMLLMAVLTLLLLRATVPPTAAEASPATGKMSLWRIPLLMLLWCNLHGGFIFGLAVLGFCAVGRTLEWWWSSPQERPWGTTPQRLWQVCGLSLLATLCNPNTIQGLIYPFTYLGNNASTRYVAEWVSPDFHQFQYLYFEALLLLLVTGAALSLRRLRLFDLALVLAFSYLSFSAVRNINLFSVAVGPIVAFLLTVAWRERPRRSAGLQLVQEVTSPGASALPVRRAAFNTLLIGLLALIVLAFSYTNVAARPTQQAQGAQFPARSVAYLQQQHLRGPLLNAYGWGGYLIWTLYPARRVYIDGRPDMYGDAFVDAFVRLWQAESGWQKALTASGAHLVLVEPDSGLGRALRTDPHWRLAYHDTVSVLYERRP